MGKNKERGKERGKEDEQGEYKTESTIYRGCTLLAWEARSGKEWQIEIGVVKEDTVVFTRQKGFKTGEAAMKWGRGYVDGHWDQ